MKTENTNQKTEVNFNDKQLEIFEKIINQNWVSLALPIKGTLNLMALTYIRSERIEGTNGDDRSVIAFHLEFLQDLIDNLRRCELYEPNIEEKKIFFDSHISGFNCLFNEPDFAYDLKNSLSGLSQDYIKSEEIEGEPMEDRKAISYHLHLLNSLVSDISDLAKITEGIRTINSVSEQNRENQHADCTCIECLKKEGTIKALEYLNDEQDKRIHDLIINGSLSKDCKVVLLSEPTKS